MAAILGLGMEVKEDIFKEAEAFIANIKEAIPPESVSTFVCSARQSLMGGGEYSSFLMRKNLRSKFSPLAL